MRGHIPDKLMSNAGALQNYVQAEKTNALMLGDAPLLANCSSDVLKQVVAVGFVASM